MPLPCAKMTAMVASTIRPWCRFTLDFVPENCCFKLLRLGIVNGSDLDKG